MWPESRLLFVSDGLLYIAKDDAQSGGRRGGREASRGICVEEGAALLDEFKTDDK